ncbi:MAG: AAA family ATPase [Verrucomicrobia bacterium]|nr:AAA family ATPase [Verrucomicrobiota bacterium]
MPKRVPYAVANYEEIVDDGYYFVDKTRFIRELEQYKIPVFLRPRRFGKSLWCSVLECYYDINRKDRFETLFGHTDIGREPTPSHNSQMVMRFDFSVVEVEPDLASLEAAFDRACRDAFRVFAADNCRHADFSGALNVDSAADALRFIISAARSAACPPLLIIIDEYDNFTNQLLTAHQDGLYRELTTGDSFLRTFYKVIKAGVGEGTVGRVFITGVLPITMDDLTSGFNIGQVITLKEHALNMMGFTDTEVDAYVNEIFTEHGWPDETREKVREDLRLHYNGYRLLPDAAETLYNSTICNYYLNDLVIGNGKIPTETIDENLRVDIKWLRRLTGSDEDTRELLEQLMFDGALPVDITMLRSKFNMSQFFQKPFFPLSLYYLGMLTFQDRFTLTFPNLTVKTIFTEYFNEAEQIEVSLGYTDMFRQFLDDHDLEALFAGYWKQYIGQIPAQAFDKANENFFRTTFFELCTRYLSQDLMFAIEVNHPSGRSDWEAIGRAGTPFENQSFMIEFKHFPRAEGERLGVSDWSEPKEEDVAQVTGYADDLKRRYPELAIRRHVLYTAGAAAYRFFTLN